MVSGKKIKVIIEKTETGFSAYSEEYPVFTTGSSMSQLFDNVAEAFILFSEDEYFDVSGISYEIDLHQFFKHYKVINAKALADRIGMNPTLLSQYISGTKKPSAAQSKKILYGINRIGQELAEMSVIYNKKSD